MYGNEQFCISYNQGSTKFQRVGSNLNLIIFHITISITKYLLHFEHHSIIFERWTLSSNSLPYGLKRKIGYPLYAYKKVELLRNDKSFKQKTIVRNITKGASINYLNKKNHEWIIWILVTVSCFKTKEKYIILKIWVWHKLNTLLLYTSFML